MSEAYKRHVIEKSVTYRKREGELKEYEKWVISAATDLCLRDVSLLDKRGKLLQLARKKVADAGYVFKKGHSLSFHNTNLLQNGLSIARKLELNRMTLMTFCV